MCHGAQITCFPVTVLPPGTRSRFLLQELTVPHQRLQLPPNPPSVDCLDMRTLSASLTTWASFIRFEHRAVFTARTMSLSNTSAAKRKLRDSISPPPTKRKVQSGTTSRCQLPLPRADADIPKKMQSQTSSNPRPKSPKTVRSGQNAHQTVTLRQLCSSADTNPRNPLPKPRRGGRWLPLIWYGRLNEYL